MNNLYHSNMRYWDAISAEWRAMRDQDMLWQRCPQEPELAFEGEALAMIREFAGDLHEKRACVIGSGDNYVTFALAGMGAQVISTDISAQQLTVAAHRADQLGLEIDFTQADATHLDGIADESFDLVCSSNGFFVWIAEPGRVFEQVYRVLKPGGFYIFYDVHPFMRPWKDQVAPLEMQAPYTATGPFEDEAHEQKNYQFHWRLSDLINPLLASGLVLRRMAESPASDPRFWEGYTYTNGKDQTLLDWRTNPRAGLPVWLTIATQKI